MQKNSEAFKSIEAVLGKTNPATTESIIGQIEYEIQHIALPSLFFDDPIYVANNMVENYLAFVYKQVFKNNRTSKPDEIACPYTVNDFKVHRIAMDEHNFLIRCDLPKPIYTPLCYRIYFVFNDTFDKLRFYTIEKGPFGTGGFLCSWDANREHMQKYKIEELEWTENVEKFLAMEYNTIKDLFMG